MLLPLAQCQPVYQNHPRRGETKRWKVRQSRSPCRSARRLHRARWPLGQIGKCLLLCSISGASEHHVSLNVRCRAWFIASLTGHCWRGTVCVQALPCCVYACVVGTTVYFHGYCRRAFRPRETALPSLPGLPTFREPRRMLGGGWQDHLSRKCAGPMCLFSTAALGSINLLWQAH